MSLAFGITLDKEWETERNQLKKINRILWEKS